MVYEYMLGYMQGYRGQLPFVSGETDTDSYRDGYIKGCAMRDGDVLMHKQIVSRYNNLNERTT